MKYIALLLLVVVLALPACGAPALEDKLSLSISAMQFNSQDLQDFLGTPLGFTLGYKLTEVGNMETGVSIGYFTVTQDATEPILTAIGSRELQFPSFSGFKMTTIPVMVTQRWKFGAGKGFRPYVGYGLGFNWTQQKLDVPALNFQEVQTRNIVDFDQRGDIVTRIMAGAQLTAGAEFGNGYFIDLKYVSGSEDITTGYTASLGKSF